MLPHFNILDTLRIKGSNYKVDKLLLLLTF